VAFLWHCLGCAGAAASGSMQHVDLTSLATNWHHPLGCQSERVLFSAVSSFQHLRSQPAQHTAQCVFMAA
jgi:hypothetical protein